MENKVQTFKATKTFRFAERKLEVKQTILFIALHGYGQLPEFFLRKFQSLPDNYHLIAPEGPHRFYLQGNSGRVGASWMTKEAREDDISDNLNWLQQLLDHLMNTNSYQKVILLGFSQGGATAARWYFQQPQRFSHLILWSSVFPPDLEKPSLSDAHPHFFVLGNQDEYYTEEQQKSELEFYKKAGFQTLSFEGKHDIHSDALQIILHQIEQQ